MSHNVDPYREALKEALKKNGDINRVSRFLRAALNAGSPDAAYALGTWYLHGHNVRMNWRRAVGLLRQAAEGNVADAMYDLALCYEKGAGTRKSLRRAVEYYLRAALHGEKQSLYEVGRCFYYGIGVAKSTRLAWIWIDRARELGVSDGHHGERPVKQPRPAHDAVRSRSLRDSTASKGSRKAHRSPLG
jgi:TPR repeat protein